MVSKMWLLMFALAVVTTVKPLTRKHSWGKTKTTPSVGESNASLLDKRQHSQNNLTIAAMLEERDALGKTVAELNAQLKEHAELAAMIEERDALQEEIAKLEASPLRRDSQASNFFDYKVTVGQRCDGTGTAAGNAGPTDTYGTVVADCAAVCSADSDCTAYMTDAEGKCWPKKGYPLVYKASASDHPLTCYEKQAAGLGYETFAQRSQNTVAGWCGGGRYVGVSCAPWPTPCATNGATPGRNAGNAATGNPGARWDPTNCITACNGAVGDYFGVDHADGNCKCFGSTCSNPYSYWSGDGIYTVVSAAVRCNMFLPCTAPQKCCDGPVCGGFAEGYCE